MQSFDSSQLLQTIVSDLRISHVDSELLKQAQERLDSLTKPRGSLGRLEEIARRLYAIHEGQTPLLVSPAILYTVAADHGVARKHVSAYPQAVTRQMVQNFLNDGGAINAICAANDITLCLVDAGCVGGAFATSNPMLLEHRLGEGTNDFTVEPAMSRATALDAVAYGVSLAREASFDGAQCLAIGEMGIGNTTSATALFAAFMDFDPAEITGTGTGLTPEGHRHKIAVLRQALDLHKDRLAKGDPIDVLACLGGFEIAVMCGLLLGGASEHLPVLVDGFIATAAYVVGHTICPTLSEYAFLTHASAEVGYAKIMERLREQPLLSLSMRLGEGTGAAVAYPLLRAACAIFNSMATFTQAGISTK